MTATVKSLSPRTAHNAFITQLQKEVSELRLKPDTTDIGPIVQRWLSEIQAVYTKIPSQMLKELSAQFECVQREQAKGKKISQLIPNFDAISHRIVLYIKGTSLSSVPHVSPPLSPLTPTNEIPLLNYPVFKACLSLLFKDIRKNESGMKNFMDSFSGVKFAELGKPYLVRQVMVIWLKHVQKDPDSEALKKCPEWFLFGKDVQSKCRIAEQLFCLAKKLTPHSLDAIAAGKQLANTAENAKFLELLTQQIPVIAAEVSLDFEIKAYIDYQFKKSIAAKDPSGGRKPAPIHVDSPPPMPVMSLSGSPVSPASTGSSSVSGAGAPSNSASTSPVMSGRPPLAPVKLKGGKGDPVRATADAKREPVRALAAQAAQQRMQNLTSMTMAGFGAKAGAAPVLSPLPQKAFVSNGWDVGLSPDEESLSTEVLGALFAKRVQSILTKKDSKGQDDLRVLLEVITTQLIPQIETAFHQLAEVD